MPKYRVDFRWIVVEADDPEAAREVALQVVAAGHGNPRVTTLEYPDDPELKEYQVYEEQTYTVMAYSAQSAIDQVIEDNNDPKFQYNVTDRSVVDGPEGWEDEEYESP